MAPARHSFGLPAGTAPFHQRADSRLVKNDFPEKIMVDQYFRRLSILRHFKQMNMTTAIIFTTKDIVESYFLSSRIFYDGDMAGCTIFPFHLLPVS